MSYDKLVDSTVLDSYFTNIGNAIRSKNGTTNQYTPSQMPAAIDAISTGETVQAANGTVVFSNGTATITLGFIPDIVTITSGNMYSEFTLTCSADFSLSGNILVGMWDSDELPIDIRFIRNQNIVSIVGKKYTQYWESGNLIGTFSYNAYKFT